MKLYRALVKLDKNNKIENVVVVDDGFSWKALLFNPLWFLFHRMWVEFIMFLLIFFCFGIFSKFGDYDIFMKISLIFMIALNSKTWYFDFLTKYKKYDFVGVAFGSNPVEAKLKIIEQIKQNNKENPEQIIFSESLLNPKYFK
jgi:hypothetical protein